MAFSSKWEKAQPTVAEIINQPLFPRIDSPVVCNSVMPPRIRCASILQLYLSRWGGFSSLGLLFHGHRMAATAPGITSACDCDPRRKGKKGNQSLSPPVTLPFIRGAVSSRNLL